MSTAKTQAVAERLNGYSMPGASLQDDAFMMYRGFGYLQTRILQGKQDQSRVLEEELWELDRELHTGESKPRICQAVEQERATLFEHIEHTYANYSNLIDARSKWLAAKLQFEVAFPGFTMRKEAGLNRSVSSQVHGQRKKRMARPQPQRLKDRHDANCTADVSYKDIFGGASEELTEDDLSALPYEQIDLDLDYEGGRSGRVFEQRLDEMDSVLPPSGPIELLEHSSPWITRKYKAKIRPTYLTLALVGATMLPCAAAFNHEAAAGTATGLLSIYKANINPTKEEPFMIFYHVIQASTVLALLLYAYHTTTRRLGLRRQLYFILSLLSGISLAAWYPGRRFETCLEGFIAFGFFLIGFLFDHAAAWVVSMRDGVGWIWAALDIVVHRLWRATWHALDRIRPQDPGLPLHR